MVKNIIEDFNNIITCIIDFYIDPLKPNFCYISTGLRGSVLRGEISMMDEFRSNSLYCLLFTYCMFTV